MLTLLQVRANNLWVFLVLCASYKLQVASYSKKFVTMRGFLINWFTNVCSCAVQMWCVGDGGTRAAARWLTKRREKKRNNKKKRVRNTTFLASGPEVAENKWRSLGQMSGMRSLVTWDGIFFNWYNRNDEGMEARWQRTSRKWEAWMWWEENSMLSLPTASLPSLRAHGGRKNVTRADGHALACRFLLQALCALTHTHLGWRTRRGAECRVTSTEQLQFPNSLSRSDSANMQRCAAEIELKRAAGGIYVVQVHWLLSEFLTDTPLSCDF